MNNNLKKSAIGLMLLKSSSYSQVIEVLVNPKVCQQLDQLLEKNSAKNPSGNTTIKQQMYMLKYLKDHFEKETVGSKQKALSSMVSKHRDIIQELVVNIFDPQQYTHGILALEYLQFLNDFTNRLQEMENKDLQATGVVES